MPSKDLGFSGGFFCLYSYLFKPVGFPLWNWDGSSDYSIWLVVNLSVKEDITGEELWL